MNDKTLGAKNLDASNSASQPEGIQLLGEMQLALIGGGIGNVTIA